MAFRGRGPPGCLRGQFPSPPMHSNAPMRYPGQQDGAGLRLPLPANHPWQAPPTQMPPEHMMPRGHHPMPMRNPDMSHPPWNMPPPFHAPVTNVGFPAGFSPHPGGMPFMRPPPQGPPPSFSPHDRNCAPPHMTHGPPDAASDECGQPVDCNDWTSESPVNQHSDYQSPGSYGHQIDADGQFQSRDGYESNHDHADTHHQQRSPPRTPSRFKDRGERMESPSNSRSSENRRGDSRRDRMHRESRSPHSSRRSRSEVTTRGNGSDVRRQSRAGATRRDSRSEVTNRESRSGIRPGESRSDTSRESRPGSRSDAVTRENGSDVARGNRSDVTRERRSWSDNRSDRTRRGTDNDRRRAGTSYNRRDADTPSRRRDASRSTRREHSGTSEESSGNRRSTKRRRSRSRSHDRSHSKQLKPDPQPDGEDNDKTLSDCVDSAQEEEVEEEETEYVPVIPAWTRCSPADLYFSRDVKVGTVVATTKMIDLEVEFEKQLVERANRVRATKPHYEPPPRTVHISTHHRHHCHDNSGDDESQSESDSSTSSDGSMDEEIEKSWMKEMMRKRGHPEKLHDELWFNEPGEMNDGVLCQCSIKSKQTGIRHDIYPGEKPISKCNPEGNNSDKLYHYRVTMSPHTNFLMKNPTLIEYDNHEYLFEGFSILSHYKFEHVPVCKVIRFNIEYTIHWFEEDIPENFTVRSLNLFSDFIFHELLELLDLDFKEKDDSCRRFHFMPRFVRDLPDNGKEMLSMNEVLLYLLRSSRPVFCESELQRILRLEETDWQDLVDEVRGSIVTLPGMRPSAIRIDQFDRKEVKADGKTFPLIIHFGIRPVQLSYVGNPSYQRTWKQFVKLKHLLANKPKITHDDRQKLKLKEERLQEMKLKDEFVETNATFRSASTDLDKLAPKSMKREVTVELCSKGFLRTGIKSDICQHAFLLPVLAVHFRFHKCLDVLEERIKYQFKDRSLLQLSLTHPSYRINFGTNPDHARNALANCGIRQLEYGDRRIHFVHSRKKGINTLIHIMAKLGHKEETMSDINHNERLEYLGDAVVEFITTIHLFLMFPALEEGGLATYRAALVQNQQLSVLGKKLQLQNFMLYAHGPDLCLASSLRHARANCFEALMGALYLDGGIEQAERVFGESLYDDNPELLDIWSNLPPHPLEEDEPHGDRHWIASSPILQKLVQFEKDTGIEFNHIRLLAKAFTMRNVGFNNLTCGHNQRLEFLGDSILQLVTSVFLFKHFPSHHEGHLSLLRSSLVNNRNQAIVCDDLGMTVYVISADTKPAKGEIPSLKTKERADLVEAFMGALYLDQGLEVCNVFCKVCFYPRLKEFIMNQHWNDPKSQLQQCCLTLRALNGEDPDIPTYKMLESTGPTNTRKYTVAVYFRGERLDKGVGRTIQQAEMNAAANALEHKADLFPQLKYQKKFIERKFQQHSRDDRKQRDSSNPP